MITATASRVNPSARDFRGRVRTDAPPRRVGSTATMATLNEKRPGHLLARLAKADQANAFPLPPFACSPFPSGRRAHAKTFTRSSSATFP
jgi:hypothetical protein